METLSRRRFLGGAVAAVSAAALRSQTSPQAPNVLFVVIDDLDCRVGCYGDPVAKTPNIDRLAARGVRFDRAYCQFPLCNPTRMSVMSGRYPTSTGVLDNNTHLVLEGAQRSLVEYFGDHGYGTAEFGKIWHGPVRGPLRQGDSIPANFPAGWNLPADRARQQAEDPHYWERVHTPYRNDPPDPERYAWANVYGPLPDGERGQDAEIADNALASMRASAAKGEPFFLAVGFHKPHVPLTAPKEFFDMHELSAMRLPPDFDTEPRRIPGYPPDEFRMNIDLFRGRSFTTLEAREAMRAYYACTSYADAQVGRLLDELERLGLAENTVVALWGDHGWHLSEKGMWAKGTLFEISARGPMVLYDPRMRTSAGPSARVVQYLDIYPTLADLCGLPSPAWTEGVSLRPLLDNPGAAWDRPAYTVQTRKWILGRSARTERWRYTEWDEGRRGRTLFDHDADPHEMRNLATDPAHAETVARMQLLLRQGPVAPKPHRPGPRAD